MDIQLFKRSLPTTTPHIRALIEMFVSVLNRTPAEQVKAMKMLYHLRYRYYISTADSSPEACKFKLEYAQAFPSLVMTTPPVVDTHAPRIDWGDTIDVDDVEDSPEDDVVDNMISSILDTSKDNVEDGVTAHAERDDPPLSVDDAESVYPPPPDAPEELDFLLSDDERASLSSDDSWLDGPVVLKPAAVPARIHVHTVKRAVERQYAHTLSVVPKGEAVARRILRTELKADDVDRAYLFKGPNDLHFAAYQRPSGEVRTVSAMPLIAEMSGLANTYVLKRGKYRLYMQACADPVPADKMYASTLDWIQTMKSGPLQ